MDTYHSMDEPWTQYAKWNEPLTKDYILYHSIYMQYQNRQIHRDRKVCSCLVGLGEVCREEKEVTANGYRISLGGDGYTTLWIFYKPLKCALKMSELCDIWIVSPKSCLKYISKNQNVTCEQLKDTEYLVT